MSTPEHPTLSKVTSTDFAAWGWTQVGEAFQAVIDSSMADSAQILIDEIMNAAIWNGAFHDRDSSGAGPLGIRVLLTEEPKDHPNLSFDVAQMIEQDLRQENAGEEEAKRLLAELERLAIIVRNYLEGFPK